MQHAVLQPAVCGWPARMPVAARSGAPAAAIQSVPDTCSGGITRQHDTPHTMRQELSALVINKAACFHSDESLFMHLRSGGGNVVESRWAGARRALPPAAGQPFVLAAHVFTAEQLLSNVMAGRSEACLRLGCCEPQANAQYSNQQEGRGPCA